MTRVPLCIALLFASNLNSAPLQPENVGAIASSGGGAAASFALAEPGSNWLVDYNKYGTFKDVGGARYQYVCTSPTELAAATGEGTYPNNYSLLRDPAYLAVKSQ